MSWKDFLLGEGSETKRKPLYNPEQEGILGEATGISAEQMGNVRQYMQNTLGGGQDSFNSYAAPARRDFEQQTVPGIAERFTGAFGEGSQNSSAFGQAMGSAGRDLDLDLQAQRTGMQGDALSRLFQMTDNMSMKPRYNEYTTDRKPGFLENALMTYLGAGAPGSGSALKGIGKMFIDDDKKSNMSGGGEGKMSV